VEAAPVSLEFKPFSGSNNGKEKFIEKMVPSYQQLLVEISKCCIIAVRLAN